MGNVRSFFVLMSLFLLLTGGEALGSITSGAFTVSPMVGKYLFEGNQSLKDRGVYGLGLGYNLDEHWAGEAVFRYINTQDTSGNEKTVEVMSGEVDLLYHFLPDQLFVPYLAGGVGAIRVNPGAEDDEDLLANYGVGFKYFFTDTTALRGDVRHILDFNTWDHDREQELYNNLSMTVGLFLQFGGGRTAAPALIIPSEPVSPVAAPAQVLVAPAEPVAVSPVVMDGDGDGVEDGRDKCPNTPTGLAVNAYGCPRDSDGDGVFDIDDRCPGTAAGIAVGADGCPIVVPKPAVPSSLALQLEFATGQSAVLPEFEAELQRAADFIKAYPASRIRIEGHTDSVGSDTVNQELSAERADSVRRHLIERYGVADERIEARGYGETRPVASNATPEGRRQNRRVVVTIVP